MLNVFCPSVADLEEAAFGPQNARVLTGKNASTNQKTPSV